MVDLLGPYLDDPEAEPELEQPEVPDLLGPYVPTTGEAIAGAGFRLAEGLAKGVGGIVAAPGIALGAGARWLGGDDEPTPISDALVGAGRRIGSLAEPLRPKKPAAAEGLGADTAGAVGSALSFIGPGAAGSLGLRALRLAPRAANLISGIGTGVAANGAGAYFEALSETGDPSAAEFAAESARAAGASPAEAARAYEDALFESGNLDQAHLAFLWNGLLVGPTEVVGLGGSLGKLAGVLSRAERSSGGAIGRALAKLAVEESSQEGLGELIGNVGAHLVGYDEDRALWEGVAKGAVLGGLAGVIVGGPLEVYDALGARAAEEADADGEEQGEQSESIAPSPELARIVEKALADLPAQGEKPPQLRPQLSEDEVKQGYEDLQAKRREAEAAGGLPEPDALTAPLLANRDGPIVVYRGRQQGSAGPVRGDVSYFTTSKDAARRYANPHGEPIEPNVLAANLALRKPATEKDILGVAKEIGFADFVDEGLPAAYLNMPQSRPLVEALRERGYDGAVGWDSAPDDSGRIKSYAVFSAEQVHPVESPEAADALTEAEQAPAPSLPDPTPPAGLAPAAEPGLEPPAAPSGETGGPPPPEADAAPEPPTIVIREPRTGKTKTIPASGPPRKGKETAPNPLGGNLPEHTLIQAPSGVWIFRGRVAPELGFINADGSPPTDEQLRTIRQAGAGMTNPRIQTRSWPTREEAEAALREWQERRAPAAPPSAPDEPAAPPAPPALAPKLGLRLGGSSTLVEVKDFADASRRYSLLREKANLGASQLPPGSIVDFETGKEVAYISYNGRVWRDRSAKELLYDPTADGWPQGEEELDDPEDEPEAAEPERGGPRDHSLDFERAFAEGRDISTPTKAAAFALERGMAITDKELDEAIELGVVRRARAIVAEGRAAGATDREVFDRLADLYRRQPKLNARTSTSRENQAYSTPVPLSWLASQLAGITEQTRVYEPTAGNGSLLIGAATDGRVMANELDPERVRGLKRLGFRGASQGDALKAQPDAYAAEVVIANPPFGKVQDGKGGHRWFKTGTGFNTKEIDHAIALHSLKAMLDDGRAVLILGGVKPFGNETPEGRTEKYRSQEMQGFYKTLYGGYKVADHFTLDGKLYDRQGAAWPIDVIVIEGRGATPDSVARPYAAAPRLLRSWDDVGNLLPGDRLGADRSESEADGGPGAVAPGREGDVEPGDVQAPGGGPSTGGVRAPGRKRRTRDRGDAGSEPAGTGAAPVDADAGVGELPDDPGGQPGRDAVDDGGRPEVADKPAEEGRPRGKARAGERGTPRAPGEADPNLQERTLELSNEFQAAYRSASKGVPMGTQVPANMQLAMDRALAAVAKEHGDIDEFVAKKLDYTLEEMIGTVEAPGYLAAEQVDALALAISNVDLGNAFINGDQTGVGKGRFVAAMLRYGMKRGKLPVFVTKSDGLFADMLRDFAAIGMKDVRPFITHVDRTGDQAIPLDEGGTLSSLPPREYARALVEITSAAKAGKAPENFDIVFTTYPQMDPSNGRTQRQAWLQSLAPHSMVLLDESHEAGGTEQKGFFFKDGEPILKETRGDFFRDVARDAWGIVFSSATYAKNPYTLSLYFRTDMGKAVKDPKELPALIARGGVPLQQMIASGLVESGQYVRRERSFEGISVEPVLAKTDREIAERTTGLIRSIFEWDLSLKALRKEQAKGIAGSGGGVGAGDSSKGHGGAISGGFASIMHNLVSQSLLALKAREAGRAAVELFNEGRDVGDKKGKQRRKPIIAVANTMEAMLDDFIEGSESQVGDVLEDFTFARVIEKYLDKTLTMTVSVGGGLPAVRVRLELPPEMAARFEEIRAEIRATDLGDLPASPLDAMVQEMEAGGLRVGEITGRELRVKYEGERVILTRRTNTTAAKKRSMRAYNDGELDALIINQSGSTGYSLHASPHNGQKTSDAKILAARTTPRHMIVAQAPGDINVFIQMLGRINRTGQVAVPAYDLLMSDLPAEKRPGAILLKKMASLSANVSANRTSAVTPAKAIDFMNVYGDEAVFGLLHDNPDLVHRLGLTPDKVADLLADEDLARRVTGYTPILEIAEQEEFLTSIEAGFQMRLEEAKAKGENLLEAQVEDIRAKTLSSVDVKPKEGSSPFGRAATLETVEGIRRKHLLSWDDLQVIARNRLDPKGEVEGDFAEVQRAGIDRMMARLRNALKANDAAEKKKQAALEKEIPPDADEKHPKREQLAASKQRQVRAKLNAESIGARVMQLHKRSLVLGPRESGEDVWMVAMREPGPKENPLAPSAWSVELASPEWESTVSIPVSRLMKATDKKDEDADLLRESPATMSVADFPGGTKNVKEIREIVTGNILAGFEEFSGRGKLAFYTTDRGARKQGLMLPRGMDPIEALKQKPVRLSGKQVVKFLDEIGGEIAEESRGFFISAKGAAFPLALVAKNNRHGKPYYLSPAARAELGGDFKSTRGEKEWVHTNDNRKKVAKALEVYERDLQARFFVTDPKYLEDARRIAGVKIPKKDAPHPSEVTDLHAGLPPLVRGAGWLEPGAVTAWLGRHFRSRGDAPATANRRMEIAKGEVGAELDEVRRSVNNLRRVVAKEHGRNWMGLPIARTIDLALKDPERMAALPAELGEAAYVLRAHMDRLSRRLITSGAASGDLVETIEANEGIYVRRSYRAHNDPEWADKVPLDVRTRARELLATWEEFAGLSDEEIDANLMAWLQAAKESAENPWAHLSSGKLGRKDLSLFKKRKDIPLELREFLGEITNPIANYANSVVKMAGVIARHEAYTAIRDEGLDHWLFERPTGKHVSRIAAEGNRGLLPLDGLYTTPEIKAALVATSPTDLHGALKLAMRLNGWIKWAKVIGGGPWQIARNLLGNIPISIANGHLPSWMHPEEWRVAFGRGELEERKELIRLGVLGESVGALEFTELRQLMAKTPDELARTDYWAAFGEAKEKLEQVYSAMDDLPKMRGFYSELAKLRRAGYAEQPARERAAQTIRDLYPTYSRIAPILKWWRRQPVLGGFLAFHAEQFRTLGNRTRLIAEELASPNPGVRRMGAERLAGQLLALSMVPAGVLAWNMLNGIDADEDDDRREFVPKWDEAGRLVWIGDELEGRYTDLSDIDPFTLFTDPFSQMLAGEDPAKAGARWIRHQAETFLWPAPFTELALELWNGKTKGGAPIDDVLGHIKKKMEPGMVTAIQRGAKEGPAAELASQLTGFRTYPYDVARSLAYDVSGFARAISEATGTRRRKAEKGIGTPAALLAEAEVERRRLFAELSAKVGAATRLGMDPRAVWTLLDGSLSKATARAVVEGRYLPHEDALRAAQ